MINVVKRKKFTSDNYSFQMCNDIQYFGEDISKIDANDEIKELVKNSINKECVTNSRDKGIIIGFEDCSSFSDYYFIVYCPKTEEIVYELVNNNNFIKTIQ